MCLESFRYVLRVSVRSSVFKNMSPISTRRTLGSTRRRFWQYSINVFMIGPPGPSMNTFIEYWQIVSWYSREVRLFEIGDSAAPAPKVKRTEVCGCGVLDM
jgi:hypothetical protein